MKVTLTIEIIPIPRPFSAKNYKLSKELNDVILRMPETERKSKSLLYIEGYEPRLIDNKGLSRYYPMAIARTFTDALEIISKSETLVMTRGPLIVSYTNNKYWDGGNPWYPSPSDILSPDEEWYVSSRKDAV